MKFRPGEGRRVFILREADRMNAAAANALLKTLEEPSAGNILLLTTARPHALPMTILSRCQHLRFAPAAAGGGGPVPPGEGGAGSRRGGGSRRLVRRQHRQGARDEPGRLPRAAERHPGTSSRRTIRPICSKDSPLPAASGRSGRRSWNGSESSGPATGMPWSSGRRERKKG